MLTFAKGLARSSGVLALTFYGRANPTLRYDHDLVTEADLAVQDYIRQETRAAYPRHQFLGEEGRTRLKERDPNAPLWVVDPVDGSASFSAGLSTWGVALSLFDENRPVLGVIHLPVTNELYSAFSGTKAFLNDREIRVREDGIDNESLLLTYSRFHLDFSTHFPGKVRSLGSTAAHMAYVARGAASAAILGNVHIWDIAAGVVILEAAGGVIRTMEGKRPELGEYLEGDRIGQLLVASAKGLTADVVDTLQAR
jgi:myo-inositol-1(or 4)-monophosphatase